MAILRSINFLHVNLMFIQCDETHPSCIQCNSAQLRCTYASAQSPRPAQPGTHAQTASQDDESATTAVEHHSPNSLPPRLADPSISPSYLSIPANPDDPFTVNLLHMQLMHHFLTQTTKSIIFGEQDVQKSREIIMKAALSAPYLMQEILALAALHLSVLLPDQKEFYHHQASGLQTRALSIFNNSHLEVDASNCIPIVLFSSLLAMHSLCDVVSTPEDDFSNFLNSFIRCLDLHRGIRAITSHSWHFLRQSELKDVFEAGEIMHCTDDLVGKECDDLRALLSAADLGQASMRACQSAIDHLQKTFDTERIWGGRNNTFTTWPVLVPTEYMDLLMKRSPEALVILAHYAVVLHNHRGDWYIGEGGKHLIISISRHLGSYWDAWMAWPNSVLLGGSPNVT